MRKCETCSKVIEHDELCFCKWEKKGMTPIEIFEAYSRGESLEYWSTHGKWQSVTSVTVTVTTKDHSTHSSHCNTDIPWARIKRKTFGFFKAINLMRKCKLIGKESTGSRYRLLNGALQFKAGSEPWLTLSGYPYDWPDSQDFYEVEE